MLQIIYTTVFRVKLLNNRTRLGESSLSYVIDHLYIISIYYFTLNILISLHLYIYIHMIDELFDFGQMFAIICCQHRHDLY
jgi:hypothetical protein